MPTKKRFKTDYPGVHFIIGDRVGATGKEKIFYVVYRKDGKLIEEKAGRQNQDGMTAARAARIRGERIDGKTPSNKARRQEKAREKEIQRWTIKRLWEEYKETHPLTKGIKSDDSRFRLHIEPRIGNKTLALIWRRFTTGFNINGSIG